MWVQVALTFLQLALGLVTWLKQKQAIDAGHDKAIGEIAAAILVKTTVAKETFARVTGMSESQVDQALKELEP